MTHHTFAREAMRRLDRAILMRRALIESGLDATYPERVALARYSESLAWRDLYDLGLRYYAQVVAVRAKRRKLTGHVGEAARLNAAWEAR